MKRFLLITLVCILFLSACGTGETLISTATTTPPQSFTFSPTFTYTPSSTHTPIPTATATPIPWQSYKMTYVIKEGNIGKLWMPVPREWDGIGMANVNIISISPQPNDIYQDVQGNKIAFWNVGYSDYMDYSITFLVDLAPIRYIIDPNNIGEYDKTNSEYLRYMQPSSRIESNNEEIIQLAKQIVGNENNPFRQAKLIHKWVSSNISGPTDNNGAGTVTLP
jgi:transglutaminase-like putative cysteine protease